MRNDNIFTIYDLMEKAGMFRSNPANIDSIDKGSRRSLYQGPIQFPKMMYSPNGETRITEPGQVVMDEYGKPQRVGRQTELVSKIVETPEEEAVLKHLGWHNHPAKAIHAAGGEAPPMSSDEQITSLEAQLVALKKQLEEAEANRVEPVEQSAGQKADAALKGARTVKAA